MNEVKIRRSDAQSAQDLALSTSTAQTHLLFDMQHQQLSTASFDQAWLGWQHSKSMLDASDH